MRKRWIIILALCAGLTGCGSQPEDTTPANIGTETTTQVSADTSEDDSEEEDNDEDDDDAPIDADALTIKGKTTSPEASSVSGKTTTSAKSTDASDKATTASGKTTETTTKANAAKTTQTSGTEAVNTEAPAEEPQVLTDPAPEADAPAEENVVSGVIYLDDGYFEGEGITIDSDTIRITGEGTYILSGSRTGMVEVDTTKKVKLKLNGVNINNPYGPAILCTDAKKLTITLIEGTYNTLSDGYSDMYDGVICSNDTLEIKGAGTLDITSYNEHGIASDDDIIIKNGNITINAVKSGMMANDDITISGGTLRVTGATNGIKSKGTLHISGGTIFTIGGKETKSALSSKGVFSLTGGYVYAIGCGASEPDWGTSSQCAIIANLSPSLEGGSFVAIDCNGMQFMYESSPYAFNTVFLSTPDIYDGMSFAVYGNGTQYGSDLFTSGLVTNVTLEPAAAPEEAPAEE